MSVGSSGRKLFVGIGSTHGDDRIGWLVADALRARLPPTVGIREAATPGDLLDWLEGIDRLVVCDACAARAETMPGKSQLHRWEWPTEHVAALRSASSHAFGLPQVLQLSDRLGTLPSKVVVFGVEGTCFDAFADLSTEVADAVGDIVERIVDELLDCRRPEATQHA